MKDSIAGVNGTSNLISFRGCAGIWPSADQPWSRRKASNSFDLSKSLSMASSVFPMSFHQLGPCLSLNRELQSIANAYPVAAFAGETLPRQVSVDTYRSNRGRGLRRAPTFVHVPSKRFRKHDAKVQVPPLVIIQDIVLCRFEDFLSRLAREISRFVILFIPPSLDRVTLHTCRG